MDQQLLGEILADLRHYLSMARSGRKLNTGGQKEGARTNLFNRVSHSEITAKFSPDPLPLEA